MPERRAPADVVLVGLGAACGIAAHVLTDAGLDVVAIEAGPRLSAADYGFDEIRNDAHAWMARPKAMHEVPTWRSGESDEAVRSPWPMLMVNAVGGTSVHYEGLSIRFLPWNFESRTRTIERYGAGAIPAGSTLADWPFGYDELEPYYDLVEHAIGVSGDGGANVFEGSRTREFPMPALRTTGWGRLMAGAADSLGWHPFQSPSAVNSRPYDGRPACTYCGFCQYNGCYCDAKGATNVNVIKRAEETGMLRIETSAAVTRIETDDEGLATGVTYEQDGREVFQPARAVLVGTFIYENARLLLLSTSKAYPNGLSNNHGRVGKDYIAHIMAFAYGLFPGRRLNLFNGIGSQVTCVDDWNADNFDHAGLDFVSGGMLSAQHELAPIGFARGTLPPAVPRWGSEWKAWLARNAQSVGPTFGQFDALPYESNYLDLDPRVRDPRGLPVIRVTHSARDNERRGYEFMQERMQRWLRAAGATEVWEFPTMFFEGRHCYGGTRMGHDPETSVVDGWGLSHEVPNLGVLGASTFPSAAGHNPTLTVQAQSWRTARRIVDAWGSIAA